MTFSAKLRRKLDAAIPASGFRPETEAEWGKVQEAAVELAIAMYRAVGTSKAEAEAVAKAIHGGPQGRLLLEMAFSRNGDD